MRVRAIVACDDQLAVSKVSQLRVEGRKSEIECLYSFVFLLDSFQAISGTWLCFEIDVVSLAEAVLNVSFFVDFHAEQSRLRRVVL